MAKRKRSYDNWNQSILKGIESPESSIIEYAMRPRSKRVEEPGPICCCPSPQQNRLGGCRPGLAWTDSSHTAIKPICRTCLKPLVAGYHRRRDQTHVIGLSKLDLDHVDIADLEAMGILLDLTPLDPGVVDAVMGQFELERAGGLP